MYFYLRINFNYYFNGYKLIKGAIYINDIELALSELQEDIKEKQGQIHLIENIDWTKPVNENEWHKICETPLRTSDLLITLVKNIFPDAENISVNCNFVYFELYGFLCALPTSRKMGIYIKTDWYKKDNGEPVCHLPVTLNMKKYFEAKDNGENWDTLFKYRFPYLNDKNKIVRFILWFGYYKWKNDHREIWDKEFVLAEQRFNKRVSNYHEERKMIHDKSIKMATILIPVLKKFSDKVYKFESYGCYSVEDILKLEKF